MLLSALQTPLVSGMSALQSISEDMLYDSESSFKEQESERRCAEKVALLAVAIFCGEVRLIDNIRLTLA